MLTVCFLFACATIAAAPAAPAAGFAVSVNVIISCRPRFDWELMERLADEGLRRWQPPLLLLFFFSGYLPYHGYRTVECFKLLNRDTECLAHLPPELTAPLLTLAEEMRRQDVAAGEAYTLPMLMQRGWHAARDLSCNLMQCSASGRARTSMSKQMLMET